MNQCAENNHDTSFLVDSGASGHYLDSDLITGLEDILAGYKASTILSGSSALVGMSSTRRRRNPNSYSRGRQRHQPDGEV